MNEETRDGILSISIMAALADGAKQDIEREQIRTILSGLSGAQGDLARLYQGVLMKKVTLESAAASITSSDDKILAYEMAVCVCDADGATGDAEKAFLSRLKSALAIDGATATAMVATADAVAAGNTVAAIEPPNLPAGTAGKDTEAMILRYAITCGALELLPQSLASVAILPLQMKMVYRIGKSNGVELDRGQVMELLAVLGLGMTSQMFEGMASKLLGKIAGKMAGGLVGGLTKQATGSAVSFATTYALGHASRLYYEGGRKLDSAKLKALFQSLLGEAKQLQPKYQQAIQKESGQLNVTELLAGKGLP